MDHPPSIQRLDDTLRRVFKDRLGTVTLNGWSLSWIVKTDRYHRVTGADIVKVCQLLDIQPASLECWDVRDSHGYGSNALEFSADLDEPTPLMRPTMR